MAGISRQCPSCGSELGEGEVFCGGCGQPVAVRSKRTAGKAGKSNLRLAIIIGITAGLLLIAADFTWNYMRDKPPSTAETPIAATTPSSARAPSTSANPSTTAPAAQTGVKLEDFVGTWVVAEEEGGEVVLRLGGKGIQGVSGPGKENKIDLAIGDNGLLKGTVTPPGEASVPLTVELSSDKKKIILTAAPPQSEYFVSVAWKEGQGPAPEAEKPAARVAGVTTGQGLDAQKKITGPTSVFSADAPGIYLSVETAGVTGETSLSVNWVYLSTGEIVKGPTQRINADTPAGFSYSRPAKGWNKGDYRAVVFLNGKESGKAEFSIK